MPEQVEAQKNEALMNEKAKLEGQFQVQAQRAQALQKALNETQTEMIRLQGAYRLLEKLLAAGNGVESPKG